MCSRYDLARLQGDCRNFASRSLGDSGTGDSGIIDGFYVLLQRWSHLQHQPDHNAIQLETKVTAYSDRAYDSISLDFSSSAQSHQCLCTSCNAVAPQPVLATKSLHQALLLEYSTTPELSSYPEIVFPLKLKQDLEVEHKKVASMFFATKSETGAWNCDYTTLSPIMVYVSLRARSRWTRGVQCGTPHVFIDTDGDGDNSRHN